jgi:hypothetical protein
MGATPAQFAGEATRILSPSDLLTNHYWNLDTGAACYMTPHKEWLTHYQPHHVPVQLGDSSIVWSEGVGVCWFEPQLEGSPAPLVCFSNVLYVPHLASNLLSLFSLTALGYNLLVLVAISLSARMVKSSSRPQSLDTALASCWATPYLPSMHHSLPMLPLLPRIHYSSGMSVSTTGHWMQLSTLCSKLTASLLTLRHTLGITVLPVQLASSIATPSLPHPLVLHAYLSMYALT